MSDGNQSELSWRDGIVPVSTRFDDPYFSLNDGLAETRHVFLAGNGRIDLCKIGTGRIGNDLGKRCLTGSGRSVEDNRGQLISLDRTI